MSTPTPSENGEEPLQNRDSGPDNTDSGISTREPTPIHLKQLKMTSPVPQLYTQQYNIINSNTSVNSVKISPDGQILAYCTSSGLIRVHEFATGKLIVEFSDHTKGINDIDFSPINSDVLASGSDDLTVRLWSIKKKKCLKILKKHTYHVTTVKFTLRGNVLITGSADETITIWDLTSGKNLKTLAAHSDPILAISLTPDNTIIASGSYDGLMRLFDCETGQCLKTLVFNSSSYGTATASTNEVVNPPISHVQYSPNGKYILSSSLDGIIRLWDYMNNRVVKTYLGLNNKPISEKYNSEAKFVLCTADYLVVSGSDEGRLLFWNLQTKQIINSEIKMNDALLGIDLYRDGEKMAICSRDGEVRVLVVSEQYKRVQ